MHVLMTQENLLKTTWDFRRIAKEPRQHHRGWSPRRWQGRWHNCWRPSDSGLVLNDLQQWCAKFKGKPMVAFFCQYSAHRAPTVANHYSETCSPTQRVVVMEGGFRGWEAWKPEPPAVSGSIWQHRIENGQWIAVLDTGVGRKANEPSSTQSTPKCWCRRLSEKENALSRHKLSRD